MNRTYHIDNHTSIFSGRLSLVLVVTDYLRQSLKLIIIVGMFVEYFKVKEINDASDDDKISKLKIVYRWGIILEAIWASLMRLGTCVWYRHLSWWRHQMEPISTLLALCVGNPPVTGGFPSQRPVTRSFYGFLNLHPNNDWANNR